MEEMRYWTASFWLLSTLTLQTLKSFASDSMTGFMARHGGHHDAQKSTRTGSVAWITSSFHLNSCSNIGAPPFQNAGFGSDAFILRTCWLMASTRPPANLIKCSARVFHPFSPGEVHEHGCSCF